MASAMEDCAKILLFIYNILLILTGLACIAIGIWMNADPYVVSYFVVLRRGSTDEALLASSALLLTAGLFILLVAILGCCGAIKRNRTMLSWYIFLLVIIMVLELTAGFLVVVFKDDIHKTLKSGMKEQIQEDYQPDTEVGDAWDFIQVRLKCCGADGSWDYTYSKYWHSMNPGADENNAEMWVPKTCCVLEFNQDRDVRHVDPDDAVPRDEKKCQEQGQGNIDTGEYLHGRGCYVRLLDYIYRHIDTIIGLGLGIGILQIIGLIMAFLLCCSYRNEGAMTAKY